MYTTKLDQIYHKTILVTGGAGFIGYHLCKTLAPIVKKIVLVDNLNDYYDVRLKKNRMKKLLQYDNISSLKADLKDSDEILSIFSKERPSIVINLAAQAGVRYSIENPQAYMDSNMQGFLNILESCRKYPVEHLIYASSSSVYGGNKVAPFSTNHNVDHPVSLYAASKKSNELMAHTYSHLYGIPTTGLRFFTVYGPWGRPDMAYFSFTRDIIEGNPIKVFNHGKMERDFTYIDDIVEGIIKLIPNAPKANEKWDEAIDSTSESFAPYKIYNIGNNKPVSLIQFINTLEKKIGKEAVKIYMDMQPGDVHRTYADVSDLVRDIDFQPNTSIEEGLGKFVDWYMEYYNVKVINS